MVGSAETTIVSSEARPSSAPEARVVGGRFDYIPVSLFASVMGLSGLSLAWRQASHRFAAPPWISDTVALIAAGTFILLSAAYLAKVILAPGSVRAEFRHPVAGNLFGTIVISLLLLPILLAPVAQMAAQVIWTVGAVSMFAFAWLIIDRWMSDRQQIAHATPAWIVPVVGLLDVPLASHALAVSPPHSLMIACVTIGLFFTMPLFTMIFSRLVFEERLPEPLQPTLLILVAPFAVGFSAYVAVTGQVDRFAEGLYALMIFMLAVLLGRLRNLAQCCPFRVGWWAVSFPLAASAGAAIRFASAEPGIVTNSIALALLALASLVITGLAVRTVVGVARGELRSLST